MLIGLTLGALAWARRGGADRRDLLGGFSARPPRAAYLAMPLLPLAAGLTYPLILETGRAVPTDEIVALLVVAGTLTFVWALARSLLEGRTT